MQRHNWIIVTGILFLLVFIGGTVEAAKFKVALLTPGSTSDAGWNALAYEGLQAIVQ